MCTNPVHERAASREIVEMRFMMRAAGLGLAALLAASGADAFAPAGVRLPLRASQPAAVCRPSTPVMMVGGLCESHRGGGIGASAR